MFEFGQDNDFENMFVSLFVFVLPFVLCLKQSEIEREKKNEKERERGKGVLVNKCCLVDTLDDVNEMVNRMRKVVRKCRIPSKCLIDN